MVRVKCNLLRARYAKCIRGRMNEITFQGKMYHLRAVRLGRRLMRTFGGEGLRADMTPARYDLLVAILQLPTGTKRADLASHLGVTRQVIDRMVHRLEELGWVTCEQLSTDRRRIVVRVTEHATSLLREARAILESAPERITTLRSLVLEFFNQSEARLAYYFEMLKALARTLGSRATHFSELDSLPPLETQQAA
jgi:DNA-binding MarR family transcriptional regulator